MAKKEMVFDYSKLDGKIREVFGTQAKFAEAMELSERTVSMKLNNLRSWKQNEMIEALGVLGLSFFDLVEYFFTLEVQ